MLIKSDSHEQQETYELLLRHETSATTSLDLKLFLVFKL